MTFQSGTVPIERERNKIRVRATRAYSNPFTVDLGQRNAVFVKRPLVPLSRFFSWMDAFAILPATDYDIVHSFNAVPVATRRPYIITFEDFLPRVPEDRYIRWVENWLQGKLLSPQCVALLAMSEYAKRQFLHQNRHFAGLDQLKQKLRVFYPAVPLRRTTPKPCGDRLKLLFVGGFFMRKGFPALMRAHNSLRKLGIPVETTVVSGLDWYREDYLGPPISEQAIRKETAMLSQEGVTHIASLPNKEVLRLMDEATFFVFPTFHDTFGYVSIESLACGTPVIATATCALPEVVEDGKCGYLLPFENDLVIGKWSWIYKSKHPGYVDAYYEAIQQLAQGISEKLANFWDSADRQEKYRLLSAGAIEKIEERFNHAAAARTLEALYESCYVGQDSPIAAAHSCQ